MPTGHVRAQAGDDIGFWLIDVWWSSIQSIAQVLEDPQAQAGIVDMTAREGEREFRSVATPVDFVDDELRPGPVPHLGEHTAEILDDL